MPAEAKEAQPVQSVTSAVEASGELATAGELRQYFCGGRGTREQRGLAAVRWRAHLCRWSGVPAQHKGRWTPPEQQQRERGPERGDGLERGARLRRRQPAARGDAVGEPTAREARDHLGEIARDHGEASAR